MVPRNGWYRFTDVHLYADDNFLLPYSTKSSMVEGHAAAAIAGRVRRTETKTDMKYITFHIIVREFGVDGANEVKELG